MRSEIAKPPRPRAGNAKLDEGKVAQIKKRLAAGDLPRIVAADYDMAAETIRKIGRGEMWRHVQPAP